MSLVFKDDSKKALNKIKKTIDVGLTEAAIHAEGACILVAPKISGHLRGSISYITKIKQKSKSEIKEPMDEITKEEAADSFIKGVAFSGEAYIGTNLEYAPHVEYGTVKQKAQPFLRTGMNESKDAIGQIIANRLKKLKIEDNK